MNKERIEQELALARGERDAFIRQAERQIAMLDGAILALERLLDNNGTADSDGVSGTATHATA